MKLSAIILLALMMAGCSARRGIPHTEALAGEDKEVQQGEILFHQYCNSCHPNGTAGLGPALNDKPLPGFAIRYQIRNGIGTMPAFRKEVISDEESKKIVAYLKALRKLD
jgi:mono/diheme cytochrome c family protein